MPGTFPHNQLQRKALVNDPGMHHGTYVTHVPGCMSESLTRRGGENDPGIPGTCATRNFRYLARGPCFNHPRYQWDCWSAVVNADSNPDEKVEQKVCFELKCILEFKASHWYLPNYVTITQLDAFYMICSVDNGFAAKKLCFKLTSFQPPNMAAKCSTARTWKPKVNPNLGFHTSIVIGMLYIEVFCSIF